ncbi:MAG: MFS transporter [Spirochaetales bacterium]|nr:MFS transporter [Spirochaetales bacterium]
MKDSLRQIYRDDSPFKPYLISLVVFGISYGLQKGVLDNYLAEVVSMTEFDRGVLEFFRELPGLLLVGILAIMYSFSAERIFKIGAVIMIAGLTMLSVIPASRALVTLSICIYSLGEHIQIGMRNSLGIQYARPGKSGLSLGKQHSFYEMGMLTGYLVVIVLFRFITGDSTTFRIFFAVSAALVVAGFVSSTTMKEGSITDSAKRRFYFRKKFTKYYILEVTYGARKQVFFTFGPYLLVLHYGANASVMSLLFAISAVCASILSPYVGKLIDRIGYKTVMVSDTLLLVIVCFFYGFSEHFFPMNVSFYICCAMYIMDSIISLASMASNVYVQELSDSPEETRATISTGVSVNHFITIFVALLGGWVWRATGIETLFTISAIIGLLNSLFASTIKTKRMMRGTP